MRRALPLALGLLLFVPLAPALTPAPPEAVEPWTLEPLGIPEPRQGLPVKVPTLPFVPGDDVVVDVVNNQNEFSIAANPLNPDNLVAGANDYGNTGDAWCRFFTSFDGGKTWTHGYLPMPANLPVSGDPAITFDKFGNVYYIGIAFNRGNNNGGANGISVSKSTDGGLTWTTTVPFYSSTGAAFHDKPYVAADPTTGALYITYTHFGSGGGISFSKSLDGGATWTARKVIGGGQFSLPVAGNNGEIFVTWTSAGAKFARSTDGGATFSVTTPMSISLGSIPVPFRWFTYPVMDIARGGPHAGRLYLAGPQSGGQTGPDLKVITSDDGGVSWSGAEAISRPGVQFMPWMAIQPDGTVGIAYMDTILNALPGNVGSLLVEGTALVQSISTKGPDDPMWFSQITTDVPSSASATVFWGDYQGLAGTSKGFHPAFGDARGAEPCSCVGTAKLNFGTMRTGPVVVPP